MAGLGEVLVDEMAEVAVEASCDCWLVEVAVVGEAAGGDLVDVVPEVEVAAGWGDGPVGDQVGEGDRGGDVEAFGKGEGPYPDRSHDGGVVLVPGVGADAGEQERAGSVGVVGECVPQRWVVVPLVEQDRGGAGGGPVGVGGEDPADVAVVEVFDGARPVAGDAGGPDPGRAVEQDRGRMGQCVVEFVVDDATEIPRLVGPPVTHPCPPCRLVCTIRSVRTAPNRV